MTNNDEQKLREVVQSQPIPITPKKDSNSISDWSMKKFMEQKDHHTQK
jgi:hypothetical protein